MTSPKFTENDNRDTFDNSGNGSAGAFPPAPSLKISKDSHLIKKPPSPSSSSSAAAVAAAAAKPRHPVIIYTHSPKVIHTNPKDFMALVQKLTGMSRSDDDSASGVGGDRRGKSPATPVGDDNNNNNNNVNHPHPHLHHNGHNSNSYNRSYTSNVAGNRKGIFVNNSIFAEDSESSSAITTEENIGEHGQVNSSSSPFAAIPRPPYPPPPSPAMFESPSSPGINYGAYLSTIPIFATNPSPEGFLCGGNSQSLASFEMDPLFFAPNMRSSFSSSSSSGFDGLTEFRDF